MKTCTKCAAEKSLDEFFRDDVDLLMSAAAHLLAFDPSPASV